MNILEKLTVRLKNLSDSPTLDAQVLLSHITGKPRAWILAHSEVTLNSEQDRSLKAAIARLEKNVPLPYVIGHWEFFGLDFNLTPNVLIPRPETEMLVERAIKWLHDVSTSPPLHALDMGTGSGCIAVALAKHLPTLNLLAVDLSSAALNIARQNAVRHDVLEQITFLQSDLLSFQHSNVQNFNLICANLPYIPTETLHSLDVYDREPDLALDGGLDGLGLIRRLLENAPGWLAPQGLILLEIDSSHGQEALKLAQDNFPQAEVNLYQDLAGLDRFIEIQQ